MAKEIDSKERLNVDEMTWKKRLSPEQYHVLREGGTEPAFTGKYYGCKEKGIYACAACASLLFRSEAKYDSGTGWPSFFEPIEASSVELKSDDSHFTKRIEVRCSKCNSHLGHVFDDGPMPTGKRYCINSIALQLT